MSDFRTGTGAILGTPAYMSPEQCEGKPVDARSDLYALGLIIYELCAGALPFPPTPSIPQMLIAHVTQAPPDLATRAPEVPPELARFVMSLLAKKPAGATRRRRRRHRGARSNAGEGTRGTAPAPAVDGATAPTAAALTPATVAPAATAAATPPARARRGAGARARGGRRLCVALVFRGRAKREAAARRRPTSQPSRRRAIRRSRASSPTPAAPASPTPRRCRA